MPKQNTRPSDYPQAVLQQIGQLAHNIVIARKRRGETQAQWAQKLGVSQPTMARIERGDPAVAMASYVMCLWLINQAEGLADLVAPQQDHAALEREVTRVRAGRARNTALHSRGSVPRAPLNHLPSADNASAGARPPAGGNNGLRQDLRGLHPDADPAGSAHEEAVRQAVRTIGQGTTNDTAAGLAALLGHPKKPSK